MKTKYDGIHLNGVPFIKFLDYEILDFTGINSDGFVLTKEVKKDCSNLWECNLGNYGSIVGCKRAAVQHFMIARPEEFHMNIWHRLYKKGSGCSHEWFTLVDVLKKENICMPKELKCGGGFNCSITYKGKSI